MNYKIECQKTGLVFYKNRKCIADIPLILREHAIISIVSRKGNLFDIGGTKQYYRKRKPVCIVDSRPNVMATKLKI